MKPNPDSHACVTAIVDGRERKWRGVLGSVVMHDGTLVVELFRSKVTIRIPWAAVRDIRRIER